MISYEQVDSKLFKEIVCFYFSEKGNMKVRTTDGETFEYYTEKADKIGYVVRRDDTKINCYVNSDYLFNMNMTVVTTSQLATHLAFIHNAGFDYTTDTIEMDSRYSIRVKKYITNTGKVFAKKIITPIETIVFLACGQ